MSHIEAAEVGFAALSRRMCPSSAVILAGRIEYQESGQFGY